MTDTLLTPHHARYFALELSRGGLAGQVEAVGAGLFDARVDLNPHQVEAALFGLRASVEQGRLLADEVGLGKTIEAGLVLCQRWAERKRRLLVLCPASLRKQWAEELRSKFGLPTVVVEGRSDVANVFDQRAVVVASYPYAAKRSAQLLSVSWDLVVCDEAHRLRNAWQADHKLGRSLRAVLERSPRLFATATPLQNSLLELFGLVSLLDDKALGDLATFRQRFLRANSDLADLKTRLTPLVQRTLRKDVQAYVRYTQRKAVTQRFRSSPAEQQLYAMVSEFLARDDNGCLPAQQAPLMTMVLRKLLASSSVAIASALSTMRNRFAKQVTGEPSDVEVEFQDEGFDEEWLEAIADGTALAAPSATRAPKEELADLDELIQRASGNLVDSRMHALLEALRVSLPALVKLGAAERAVIFTESRKTQERLREWLQLNGYADQVVCFHGGGPGPAETAILNGWLRDHPEAASAESRAVNLRSALIDHFRVHGKLLLATEAGAEGLNLQFCSMVVNYDLPWNPQRIEQRIGRCHRYGQKHDVVVVNFLDESNAAEQRVLQLLQDKLGLFDGLLGSSDEILGVLGSGAGLELRLHRLFRTCRTPAAIETAFAELRAELDEAIKLRETQARQALLEHFDADVHDRIQVEDARRHLDRIGRLFWRLARWALGESADFDNASATLHLHRSPRPDVLTGTYELVRAAKEATPEAFVLRLNHPLGEHVLNCGATVAVPVAQIRFDASGHPVKISSLRALVGQQGWLVLERLTVSGLQTEDHLLFSGTLAEGDWLDGEVAQRLFELDGHVCDGGQQLIPPLERLDLAAERARRAVLSQAAERNGREFQAGRERLERWADDQIVAAELAVKEARAEIRALEKKARLASDLAEQHQIQTQIRAAESRQGEARRRVFHVEDEVRARRNQLLDELERRVAQKSTSERVFVVGWQVV